MVKSTPTS